VRALACACGGDQPPNKLARNDIDVRFFVQFE
jgi:hypothetical protein